jgi:hypothetical protein
VRTALTVAAGLGVAVGAAHAFDNCTPQVTIVYWGATAVNPSINQAAQNLYGAPLSTCSASVRTYQGLRQLLPAPAPKTCVRAYVASGQGSCEGVQALDQKQSSGVSVCNPVAGATNTVPLVGLLDETSTQLSVTLAGSDVSYALCKPVIPALTREYTFQDTENKAFVIPFTMIVNKALRAQLPARKVITPGSACPNGANGTQLADCPRVDLTLTRDQLQGIYANNNVCDWRFISPNIATTNTNAIGAITRVRVSGTRRNFNATMLGNLSMGQGVVFGNGTGDVVGYVNNNQWCGNLGTRCGESAAGVVGGQTSPCQTAYSSAISLGLIGTDRCTIVDPGTPADPFDDYCARQNTADNWDALGYSGEFFNKAKVQCGNYSYWSFERLYYDEDYMAPGSTRETAVQELVAQTSTDAVSDPAVVANSQLYVSRASDGAAVFPTASQASYNTFCKQP